MKKFNNYQLISIIIGFLIIWVIAGIFWSENRPKSDIELAREQILKEIVWEKQTPQESVDIKVSSTYPGCDKPDVAIGQQIWSSCNIGSKKAGTWSDSRWDYFVFWSEKKVQDFDWSVMNPYTQVELNWKSKRGPCAVNYHIPSPKEWQDVFTTTLATLNRSYLHCSIELINDWDNYNCNPISLTIAQKLLLPITWYYEYGSNGVFRTNDDRWYNSLYWTNALVEGGTVQKFEWKTFTMNLDSTKQNVGQSTMQNENKGFSRPIRCIKD